jgi:hypothetical protein
LAKDLKVQVLEFIKIVNKCLYILEFFSIHIIYIYIVIVFYFFGKIMGPTEQLYVRAHEFMILYIYIYIYIICTRLKIHTQYYNRVIIK